MPGPEPIEQLAQRGAREIHRSFDTYHRRFLQITRRAKARFEAREWRAGQRDGVDRIELYGKVLRRLVQTVEQLLGPRVRAREVWGSMRRAYADLVRDRPDAELAETFFNSVTRRIFATVGVDPEVEFVNLEPAAPAPGPSVSQAYAVDGDLVDVVRRMLADHAFSLPFRDPDRAAGRVARRIEERRAELGAADPVTRVDLITAPFYRQSSAYLVGRVLCGARQMPLVVALVHGERGVVVDAVLLTEDEVSVVFGFTRSYFRVDMPYPSLVIAFLRTIMPGKPVAELYISIGYNKHGKTELFRRFLMHLQGADDPFVVAPGARGMVMVVFTMPSYDLVFKVIRDAFDSPKDSTREEVRRRYTLVFKHDRAGRLIDAQEFEHLAFRRDRFSDELLEELQRSAAQNVTVTESVVAIRHLYIERRLRPLDLFLQEVDEPRARAAALDYGQAVRELALSNVFPGDLLPKNFGVTRHGRVVFYDYDELCLLTDCRVRQLPEDDDPELAMAAEPWFHVEPGDIFPEQFVRFLGFRAPLRDAFLERHGDLFTARFWREAQDRHRRGEIFNLFPYPDSRRFLDDAPA